MTPERRAHLIKQHARSLGFTSAGITDLSPPPHADALTRWLDDGMAASMEYMRRQAGRRLEPRRIVAGATRAVVVTRNYYRPDPAGDPARGMVAKYARGRDYHEALRPPLAALGRYVASLGEGDVIAEAYLDAGPVPERELAQRAGLGWIGKNTMLIDPVQGSFFFIGTVLTDLEIALDAPFEADRCGSCRRCLDACPTGAFARERVLDSRRCISYLTIEHRGEVDPALHRDMGSWVFGCDVCQDVCPWNHKFARPADDPALQGAPDLALLPLGELQAISDSAFEERYGWTALERPGAAGMRRNAAIAARNAPRVSCDEAVEGPPMPQEERCRT